MITFFLFSLEGKFLKSYCFLWSALPSCWSFDRLLGMWYLYFNIFLLLNFFPIWAFILFYLSACVACVWEAFVTSFKIFDPSSFCETINELSKLALFIYYSSCKLSFSFGLPISISVSFQLLFIFEWSSSFFSTTYFSLRSSSSNSLRNFL